MNDLEKALNCYKCALDDVEKALSCYQCALDDVCFGQTCTDCHLYQRSYLNDQETMEAAIKRIHELEKSNRNWRRKVQRLRKELKEVKADGVS